MALQKLPLTSSPAHVIMPTAAKVPPGKKPAKAKTVGGASAPFWVGLGISFAWICTVFFAISKGGAGTTFGGLPMSDWALGVTTAISPVAMVWMITAYLQRATDIHTITDPLRRQLTLITGESGAADARIRRFNEAIREQVDLLRDVQNLSQEDLEAIVERMQHHRADLEQFENTSSQHIKNIQDVIRQSMFQIEQLMDDKFTMLRVLDGKLQQNGDALANKIEGIGGQVATVLSSVEQSAGQIASALDRAQHDSQKLADTASLQQSSLVNATQAASDTLNSLSGKIDLSVAKFLERASSAREEAERLAQSFDAQTRAMDDFSTTMPIRVSDAESALRGVADRLYACEQMAREQATNLTEKLAEQVDGMQGVLDRFNGSVTEAGSGLTVRRNELNALIENIRTSAANFFEGWEKTVDGLNDRMGNSLLKFTVVNDETRRNAEIVTGHLNETTSKYEDVVLRMRNLSGESSAEMKAMTEEFSTRLAQFEKLNAASAKAGEDVQVRANAALQNLQQVLERVLSARDSAQTVGQTLVKDIAEAVAQNEAMIQRLNETAQLSARSISAVTENLTRQEAEMFDKARASESVFNESVEKLQEQAEGASKTLRDQTANLMSLLGEVQSHLSTTDEKLQTFATQAVAPVQQAVQQIDSSADQGLRSLGAFNEGLSAQVERLRDFHTRIGDMNQQVGKTTAESASAFEALTKRFAGASAAQEESARQILTQFSNVSERLQREVSGLDTRAASAVDLLQKAATLVNEQSVQMMDKAKESGERVKEVAVSLQAESARIQSQLHEQTEHIGDDLSLAERRFSSLGDIINEKAVVTRTMLDATASRYDDVAKKLDQTLSAAQGRVENLHTVLSQEIERIGGDTVAIERHANDIAASSGRAVENLSALKDEMVGAHKDIVAEGTRSMETLEGTAGKIQTRTVAIADAVHQAADAVAKTGDMFDARADKLIDNSQQIASALTQLTQATDVLSEKSSAIRANMEQENNRLMTRLTDSVLQMDATSNRMKQIVASVSQNADQASVHFGSVVDAAKHADDSLATLGVNVTKQAAAMSIVGEQIGAQQRVLAEANEKQRTQMLETFEKLNATHARASEIAERSISSLSGLLKEIDRQAGEISDKAVTAVGNVKVASVGFSEQSVLLLQNAQAAEQQARSVLQATSALQEQAAQLRVGLQAESDRATESLTSLLGRLTSGSSEVRSMGTDVNATLSSLQSAIEAQTGELNGTMSQIIERQRVLTSALDAQRDTLDGLLNRLSSAQDEAALTAERGASRLADSAQKIMQQSDAIDIRAKSALASVQAATEAFAKEATAVDAESKEAEKQAQAILVSTTSLHEKIGNLRAAMQRDGGQTTEALDVLLNRITTGSGELRDVGVSTEKSLESLQRALGVKTDELNATMQQVDGRQQALVAALDKQRESISSILARYNQAQEETLSVAERTASRLKEEAQNITSSIDLIGAQASSTLGNVQESVSGFTEQAAVIKLHSQEAEKQVRELMSTTSNMQGKAAHLREAVQAETSRVVELLSSVIEKLDSAGRRLKAQSGDSMNMLDQTAARFSTVAQSGADVLVLQTQALNQTIDEVESRLAKVNERSRTQAEETREFGDKAEAQAKQLANSAEFATTRLATLRDTIATIDKDGTDAAATVAKRIDEVKTALEDEMKRLAEASKVSADQVAGAVHKLATESGALRASLASSESALNEAAEFVREEAHQLPSTLGRSVEDIESASKKLKDKAAEANQILIGTADKFISVTAGARDNMAQEIKRVSNVAEDAGKILTGFNQLLTEQVAAMQQGTALLSGEQRDLIERASRGVETLSEATERLTTLRTEASATAERLTREFDALDQRATSTGSRLAQAGEGIMKQVEAITEATVNAEKKISGVGGTLREQLETIRTGIQGQIDDINKGLAQITTQLERTGNNLRSTAVGAVADVERVGQRFEQTGAAASMQVKAETDRLRKATDAVGEILVGFDKKFSVILEHMAKAGTDIRSQEGSAIEHLQRMLGHLGQISEKLEGARSMSGDVSKQAIDRLDEVVNAVQSQMNKMTSNAQTAAGIMRGIGQIYNDQTTALAKGMGDAHNQVVTMNKSIDDMQQRADRMRAALKMQGEDLMTSLHQILVQLELTGDGLTDAVNTTLRRQAMTNKAGQA